jgi:hypothetical protein
MKPAQMDADLAKITDPQQMSYRLGYWETRKGISKLTPDEKVACEQIAIRHASRVARVVRFG